MIEFYARAQSSRTRLEEEMSSETTKAAAWAVFQHHGGSTNYNRSCGIGVRRATRFKIEAQMKKNHGGGDHSEGLHAGGVATSLCSSSRTVKNHRWDAGSTLFDSYELDSLSKQFDRAFFFQLHQQPSSSCCSSSHTTPEEELFLSSSSSSSSSATTRSLTSCRDEESRRCQSSPSSSSSSFLDTTRMTSPFSRHQSHRDARVLPSERMRDSVEDSYTLEHRCSFQSQGANPMQRPVVSSIDANTAYRDEHHQHHERDEAPTTTTVDGQNAAAGASGKSPGRSSVSSCCMEKGAMAEEIQAQKLLHEEEDKEQEPEPEQAAARGLQFAGHTPNPLNLSQRKWRSCVDYKSSRSDVSADGGGPMMRQSFQEKLRSFFHKARISPQDSSPHKLGRKSYTGPENSSSSSFSSSSSPLYGSWSYWNHVDDNKKHNHTPEESDELLYKSHHRHKHRLLSLRKSGRDKKLDAAASDPAAAAAAPAVAPAAPAVAPTTTTTAASDCHKPQGSKQKKSGSMLFRSVTHALQASLPHFGGGGGGGGGSESRRHRKSSNVTEHKHHHTIYHHHHVVIHQQQQQQLQQQQQSEQQLQQLQLEDYELKLQDIIDRRVPRKTFEEHQGRRISFEDRK